MYRHEAANAVSVNDKIEAVRSDGARALVSTESLRDSQKVQPLPDS